jgi:hypothetical protein
MSSTRRLPCIAAALFLFTLTAAFAEERADRALASAKVLVQRMQAFDSAGIFALTDTTFLAKLGADLAVLRKASDDAAKNMKTQNALYTSFELLPPEAPFVANGRLYVFIPYRSILQIQKERTLQEAFFIAVSDDSGASWKFTDGAALTEESIVIVIPGYSGKLPPRSTRRVE